VLDEQRNAYQPFLYAIFAADLKAPIGTRSRYFWYQLRRPLWQRERLLIRVLIFACLPQAARCPREYGLSKLPNRKAGNN
jgi:hypothetical protein